MKKFLSRLSVIIMCMLCAVCVLADTITINWLSDDQVHTTTTCTVGDDLILPTPPTKYGYTFNGWTQYTFLEFIQSDGAQYINTGVIPTNTTGFEVKFNRSVHSDQVVIGTSMSQSSRFFVNWASGMYLAFGSTNNYLGTAQSNVDVIAQINFENCRKKSYRYADETTAHTYDISENLIDYTIPMYLFAGNNQGTAQWFFRGKIYYCKITDNNTIIRNFIPARRESDMAIGMYDTVNHNFYTNIGTGTFAAGPVAQ